MLVPPRSRTNVAGALRNAEFFDLTIDPGQVALPVRTIGLVEVAFRLDRR